MKIEILKEINKHEIIYFVKFEHNSLRDKFIRISKGITGSFKNVFPFDFEKGKNYIIKSFDDAIAEVEEHRKNLNFIMENNNG